MEVYVDDILVKSRSVDTHLIILGEAFATIKKFRIGLNPAKCAFSISLEKYFITHQWGIYANLKKV